MTVKELREQLSHFNDNLMVMIPKADKADNYKFEYRTVHSISQGVNELDGMLFLEDIVCCETCIFCPNDLEEEPCCSCTNCAHWEPKEDPTEE